MITGPLAAALGAMETGIAANRVACFPLILVSERENRLL